MKQPKFSVIVPVYKAEKHINKCIECILAQTFADFELILVNDGSPDNSGIICDDYAAKDSRIKVIHKENGGASDARNRGLDIASGELICFVDSDDYIDCNFLEIFMGKDADMVVQGLFINNLDENRKEQYKPIEEGNFSTKCIDKFIDVICNADNIGYLFTRSFKREIIEKNRLRLNTNFELREDQEFILRYMLVCKTFATINKGAYHYDLPVDFYNKYKNINPENNILCTISIIENFRKMTKLSPKTLGINVIIIAMSVFNLYRNQQFNIEKIEYYTNIFCNYYRELKNMNYKTHSQKAHFVYYLMGTRCPRILRRTYLFIFNKIMK